MYSRLLAIVIVVFALAACGQKGPLVLPPQSSQQAPASSSTAQ